MLLAVSIALLSAGFQASGEPPSASAPAVCARAQAVLDRMDGYAKLDATGTLAIDANRFREVVDPPCRHAIEQGHWPVLRQRLLSLADASPSLRAMACETLPRGLGPVISDWETSGERVRDGYDVACATALLRSDPQAFARVVAPRLTAAAGCNLAHLTTGLAEALDTRERGVLLPALAHATRARLLGRDELYGRVCTNESLRAEAPDCRAEPRLEERWIWEARLRRAMPVLAWHIGGALLYGVLCLVLWAKLRSRWPGTAMSRVGTMATVAFAAWSVVTAARGGEGALSAMNFVAGMIALPVAALGGAVLAWVGVRALKIPPLPWCLAQMVLYGVVSACYVWEHTWWALC